MVYILLWLCSCMFLFICHSRMNHLGRFLGIQNDPAMSGLAKMMHTLFKVSAAPWLVMSEPLGQHFWKNSIYHTFFTDTIATSLLKNPLSHLSQSITCHTFLKESLITLFSKKPYHTFLKESLSSLSYLSQRIPYHTFVKESHITLLSKKPYHTFLKESLSNLS